ncbi:MAG: phosphoribosylanthranilate isomerase [Betaproteobacteria bacterium]|nr:phosphoribosylanthranilate isomerase [Betaproteobacteria bacterium]
MPPRIKICCISSVEEAQQAVLHGAAALGLVSQMPSGPGVIPDGLIAEIAQAVPPPIATFLLTARQDADAIAEQHAVCGTSTLQLVDAVAPSELQRLRRKLPHVKLVQVIHVLDEASIDQAKSLEGLVDALLLDSGNPTLQVKELGGTGRVHDWGVSRRVCAAVKFPVFLAGGLRATNVTQAIEQVRPFGLDLCSSVRTDGRLDVQKLELFMRAVRSAV